MNLKSITRSVSGISPNLLLTGGLLFAGYKLLQKFGLFADKGDRDFESFSKQWYWTPNGTYMTAADGKQLTDALLDAPGLFNDNEEQVYNVFRAMPTKKHIQSLAYWFAHQTNQDLYFWLDGVMNQSEMLNIKKIIDSKPHG